MNKGRMTVEEAGRLGGTKTAQTHGREFYRDIGRKGGQTTSQTHGKEFYENIGKKGGAKGGRRVRDLIQKAKEE